MNASAARAALLLAALTAIGFATGCNGNQTLAPAAADNTLPSSTEKNAARVVGVLSLKGSEPGSWWAITEDSGAVTRLENASDEQLANFRQWQNRRIEVRGMRLAPMLGVAQLTVTHAQLLR